jgi:prolyl-tRNA synthetase
MENGTVEVSRRDLLEKQTYLQTDIENKIEHLLQQIQLNLYQKALNFRDDFTFKTDNWEEFKDIIENKGGFVYAHYDGTTETEDKIKEETKATIRVIPFGMETEGGKCVYTGKPTKHIAVFARAY